MNLINLFTLTAQAHSGEVGESGSFGHMMSDWMGMGGGSFMGGTFMILFWVLVITGVVYLIKHLVQASDVNKKQEKTPTDILKERYAEGEIDRKEFEEKAREIKNI